MSLCRKRHAERQFGSRRVVERCRLMCVYRWRKSETDVLAMGQRKCGHCYVTQLIEQEGKINEEMRRLIRDDLLQSCSWALKKMVGYFIATKEKVDTVCIHF